MFALVIAHAMWRRSCGAAVVFALVSVLWRPAPAPISAPAPSTAPSYDVLPNDLAADDPLWDDDAYWESLEPCPVPTPMPPPDRPPPPAPRPSPPRVSAPSLATNESNDSYPGGHGPGPDLPRPGGPGGRGRDSPPVCVNCTNTTNTTNRSNDAGGVRILAASPSIGPSPCSESIMPALIRTPGNGDGDNYTLLWMGTPSWWLALDAGRFNDTDDDEPLDLTDSGDPANWWDTGPANWWDTDNDAPLEDFAYWAAWIDLATVPRLLGTRSRGVPRSGFGRGNWRPSCSSSRLSSCRASLPPCRNAFLSLLPPLQTSYQYTRVDHQTHRALARFLSGLRRNLWCPPSFLVLSSCCRAETPLSPPFFLDLPS